MKINTITLENYKSIKKLDKLSLKNITILVGSNGAGKSNLISVFKLLNKIIEKQLKPYSMNKVLINYCALGLSNQNLFQQKSISEITNIVSNLSQPMKDFYFLMKRKVI
jgi:AAA15 family ATPase/GTPase